MRAVPAGERPASVGPPDRRLITAESRFRCASAPAETHRLQQHIWVHSYPVEEGWFLRFRSLRTTYLATFEIGKLPLKTTYLGTFVDEGV
jgi:hypothetical protein